MKHSCPPYLKMKLRTELERKCFVVSEPLRVDNRRHIQQKKQPSEWSYVAWLDTDPDGNIFLRCSFGFTKIGKQWDFSAVLPKLKPIS